MKKIATGFARGLESHSSVNLSSQFHPSEVIELSSIRQAASQHSSFSEHILVYTKCKFCGKPANKHAHLIQVCNCDRDYVGHPNCLKNNLNEKCNVCRCKYNESVQREPSILGSFASQQVSATPRASSLSESSGEERMRQAIKAATLKPHCRLCKGYDDRPENKLIYPCQCHTVDPEEAWAHKKCVIEYVLARQKDKCATCKARYAFSAEYVKKWVCSEGNECKLMGFRVGLAVLVGLMCGAVGGYLFQDNDFQDTEEIVKLALLGLSGASILLCLCYIVLSLFVYSYSYYIRSLSVLCQKQEIAKMTSKSHKMFCEYIETLRANHLLPEIPVVQEKKAKPKNSSLGNSEREPEISRLISCSRAHGEDFDSEDLREHSEIKESEVIHISLYSRE